MKRFGSASMRWVYLAEDESGLIAGVPELLQLGYQKLAEAHPIPLHSHDQSYEFVYVVNGNITWEIGGEYYPVNAGQWFYTRPGELHRARFDHLEPSRIWWFVLKAPSKGSAWLRLDQDDVAFVADRLQQLPRIFPARSSVSEQFTRLKTTIESDMLNKQLFARHQVLDILLGMLQQPAAKPIDPDLKQSIASQVKEFERNPEARYSIEKMAHSVGVSVSHFYKLFYELYGQAPVAYMERIRMEHACTLLKTDRLITDIAMELGFKTSQHFTTVFKKLIGSSPSEWRKHVRDRT
ncbi:hypothetical protein A8709_13800 [Paenibacillus pectinilyticus]|uniref:HTH araC/xylS-type domain-containing protein n=1 Tax=Paenibacillus pectinilyticus TaxID=512399 RepID=A0A1C1A3P5_9BACL|nr:AraC family transcriptional regulator [Paenibacillus pectinilyticus]OCT15173.1 hypothetical protein A8709_13800 [Paenibacillus pectinilyticus]